MMHSFLTAAVLAASTLTSIVSAVPLNARGALAPTCSNNGPFRKDAQIAVYYGQGPSQDRLSKFCAQSQYDVIPVGFVNGFGNGWTYDSQSSTFKYNYGWPSANFGNQCGSSNYTLPNGTVTNMFTSCESQLGPDIAYCQGQGKKITLSIGGANDRSPYQLGSDDEGRDFAEKVWGMFGPKTDAWGDQPRPFGDVVVDGIDLDLEMGSNVGYAAMAKRFRELMGDSKLLTAAPQCSMPDSHLTDALAATRFDHIYVQFYNTDSCSAAAGVSKIKGGSGNNDINFKAWADFANGLGQSPSPKVFIGLPGSPAAASDDRFYISASDAKTLLDKYHKYPGFGGVMIWEATYARTNQDGDYTLAIKKALDDCYGGSTCSSSTTSSSTTSTSSSTSSTSTTTTTTSSSSSSSTTTTSTVSTTSVSSTSSSTSTIPTTTPSGVTTITTGTSSTPSTSSTTTTSPSFTFPHGPFNTSTTSTDSTTTSTSSFPHPPFGTTTTTSSDSTTKTTSDKSTSTTTTKSGKPTTSSEDHPWGQWTLTTSRSADPTTKSTEWSTWATTTSKPVDPASTWSQWSTTSKPVDPISSTWLPWTGESSVYVTTTTTVYVDVCPTGYITKTATLTATITVTAVKTDPAATSDWNNWNGPDSPHSVPKQTGAWPTNAGGIPSGFYTTETVCKAGCAATPITVTVTIPVPTGAITKTVVPTQAPDAAVGTGKPGSPVAGVVNSASSDWNTWTVSNSGSPVAAATGSSSASASWSTWATGTAGSPVAGATGVQGVKVYAGGAAAEQAPATAFSIAVCLALAIAGLVL